MGEASEARGKASDKLSEGQAGEPSENQGKAGEASDSQGEAR